MKPDPLSEVYSLILSGATEVEVEAAVAERWPDEDAKPLIARAIKRLCEAGAPDPAAVRGWRFEALRGVYRAAVAAGDLRSQIAALKELRPYAEVEQ
jgi:hypothetical protein